ncbi:hypothetical protein SPRG_04120 [Saprolegnia parasitica CBS 223.65]|uniref:Cystatin domain-containing protein n=1 Tax=Saprolegnia parasitica (strain CBS 223.65) TaxID=695850 RepID=A0A067CY87_SAPPC|nr:hypothetical protein SPRG_04120 [Saprolegnia parasitica CBS 223.65]KDO31506.1 hypothetical protein SPRG_04120 [Saprolegnia parasitica CBS 223.65]|eukprot:XP_012198093.1 hypothetical protein SPRG_04120 [Saprolegnia parasitica CBS 223.65]
MVRVLAFALASLLPAFLTAQPMLGGWHNTTNVTEGLVETYYSAVASPASYAADATLFVCATSLTSVSAQVVSGMNYIFHVEGCAVHAATDSGADCTCPAPSTAYDVAITDAPWMQMLSVTSITPV